MTSTITVPAYITNQGYKDWWCPCGIYPADVIAAYAPKGAASYFDSLINLANNEGVHDAFDDGHTPGWNATDGWVGNNQYLSTDINPGGQNYCSMLVRYTNPPFIGAICGSNGAQYFGIDIFFSDNINIYNEWILSVSYPSAPAIAGFAGNKGYVNGIEQGTIQSQAGSTFPINALGWNRAGSFEGTTANIQAEVWYNKVLTPSQMFDVYTAMNAL